MNTLAIISPLAIICLLGYLTVRIKLFNKSQIDALTAICFNLLIPIFLFKSTFQTDLTAQVSPSWFSAFYLPVSLYFLAVFVLLKLKTKHNANSAVAALTASYSNTVIIAIPVITFYLSEQSAGRAFVLIAFHSAILFSLTEVLVNNTGYKTLLKTIKNPIVLSILAGLSCNLLGAPIPDWLLNPMGKLSQSAIALALFGLGASMYFLPIKGSRLTAFYFSIAKLFILPFLVYLLATYGLSLTSEQIFIAVLLVASPTGVGAYIMATKYKIGEQTAASTVVLSTVLSPLSYFLWIEFLL
jgi:predicted permease